MAEENLISNLATISVAVVAALHVGFLLLEMVYWTRPIGRKLFAMGADQARTTATLAANQGLYNGFLAAGLVWGLIATNNQWPIFAFFLTCVIIAGMFGALTVNTSIFWVQAAPAIVALVLTYLTR